jgi:hypothetical protein
VRIRTACASPRERSKPYARVNVYRASAHADSRLRFEAATARVETASGYSAAELAGGFTLALTSGAEFYGELGRTYSAGGDVEMKSSVQGSIGLRLHR